jgi:eukaryotic-like serine/threonine-protein kinase
VEPGPPYPRRFGKYILLAPLAQGGMGELHLAYSGRADLKKLCVIKTILSHLADEEFTNRFLDEATVVVKLSHGNLVPVFEAGEVEGQHFTVMEYIEGKDLRDLWQRMTAAERRCPPEVALYIAREICRGLSYVHAFEDLHLVHRDVSPPNVLLSYSGEVRLTDFGVATSTIKLQKTAPGILLGKLSYMSPEQARNEAVDARADIYSVGVILWELLTGRRLFPPDKDQLERYQRAINPQVDPPSRVNPSIPPPIDLIALRSLAPQRENRYSDAEELRRDLAAQLAKLGPTTDSSSVQQLLRDLYGTQIEREREDRRALLESMSGEIKRLMDPTAPVALVRASTQPATPPVRPDDETGPILRIAAGTLLAGRYRIQDLIGEGGMGTVYTATHVEIEKQVAVKVLHPIYGRMPDVVSRFRAEARAASRIGHPHIVEVFDSGTTDDGSIYFVMEHLTGVDLAEVLDNEERLGVDRAIRIATQVCEAVAAAHESGIIHRDLKPENIFLVTREGDPDFVKVLDFGIAKSTELEATNQQRLTHPGMAMGTPEYMAPEQAAGKPSDHRVDIYAAGALLYEMIVGQPPHAGDNVMAVLTRKATEPVVPPRQLRAEVPETLEQLILWALRYEPEGRPQTMSQLVYELNKLTRGRAGAVASILGIPGVSGPPVGPAISKPGSSTERVPGITAPQGVPWRRRPSRRSLVIPAFAMLAASLTATAVLLLVRFGQRVDVKLPTASADGPAMLVRERTPDRGIDGPPSGLLDVVAREMSASVADSRPRRPFRIGPQIHIAAGRRYLLGGRFAQARMEFETAARHPRARGAAYLGLAEVEFQLSQYAAAERFAKDAVKQGGGLRAKLVLGNIYFKLRDYKRAITAYKAVLELDARHKEAQRNLAATQRLFKP